MRFTLNSCFFTTAKIKKYVADGNVFYAKTINRYETNCVMHRYSVVMECFFISQDKNRYKVRTIAFYNVENLFDTINNPNTFDDDGKRDNTRDQLLVSGILSLFSIF